MTGTRAGRLLGIPVAAGAAALIAVTTAVPAHAKTPRAEAITAHSCTDPSYRHTENYYGLYAGYSWAWNVYVGYGQSGNTSARIKEIQCLLKYAHKVDPGPVDGLWGPGTHGAVLRYQASVGLAADGVVGPRTWRSLRVGGRFVP